MNKRSITPRRTEEGSHRRPLHFEALTIEKCAFYKEKCIMDSQRRDEEKKKEQSDNSNTGSPELKSEKKASELTRKSEPMK